MKKWISVCICIALIGIILFNRTPPQKKQQTIQKTVSPTSIIPTFSRGIFVPYWSSIEDVSEEKYDTYYYFGVQPTAQGTLENESGLQSIRLVKNIPEKQKKLVLRMLDSTITEVLLDEKQAQKELSSQLTAILSTHSFSGIVLDIEVPFTLNPDKKDKITKLVQLMCTAIQSDYKTCSLLIYGDSFYKSRPYDIKKLGSIVDTILIMAYDFHKAGGEPGPNFPFSEKQKYGYDFKQMITDFLTNVPHEKIEVVFGMYGYDWTLNEQGMPLKTAAARSVNAIKLQVESSIVKVIDNEAREKKIEYVDGLGKKHILWYEDEESAAVKTKYLQQQGVGRVSFWAQSYF